MRSAPILRAGFVCALGAVLATCSSPQSSTPPPDLSNNGDQTPVTNVPPPAPEAGRSPAIAPSNPLYSRVEGTTKAGECQDDSACLTGGCSAEVCSSEQVQTTCEAREWPTKGASCGCVSGQCVWYTGDEPGAPQSTIVAEFAAISERMCQCKNRACAEQVNQEFEDWLKRNENAKGSQGEQEKAKKIAEEYTKCMMSAMTGAPDQTEKCGPGDRCGDGLTCITYYGVAGASGPQFKTCEIPCGKGKATCPTGQKCANIADGPGQVCRK